MYACLHVHISWPYPKIGNSSFRCALWTFKYAVPTWPNEINYSANCRQWIGLNRLTIQLVFIEAWLCVVLRFLCHNTSSSGSRGGGCRGGHGPPGPVKTSHKKDGRQRRPHRFHVSWPPLPGRWIRCWVVTNVYSNLKQQLTLKLRGHCGISIVLL